MTEETAEYMASKKLKKQKIDYSLYLVTDRSFCPPDKFLHQIEQAVLGGVSIVQLREKDASSLEFYNRAVEVSNLLKNMCSVSGLKIPFLINDRLDIALAVDCDGLHIGQEDLPVSVCRRLLGPDKILGVSAGSVEEAVLAEKEGADYLGVVAFSTGTKPEAVEVSLEMFKEIREAVSIPIVAIGGINLETISLLSGLRIDGVAVVSAIMGSEDAKEAAEKLSNLIESF
ncbi:thiamine phosphate synthase [Methanimicrococcus blatticola]|uniref:Thiamine-phosphate synthase n=1 Tax=Methanimicrococcus blatticola TaxID=91560 RepID=A0A484F797_9EURY|nr:thiamine phosphate synthase [Methanimicrococcus blatticola]MBZ3934927.1 thiamine phosphate synthase [Methanimicrococcus blatticola]MCC2508974.1 thiamine phosphate synthase [Methanimicrococcus blatticola]TDQ70995.1 thiamine-phosphate diphosphorylase [Methanimicrococcus blatticola]